VPHVSTIGVKKAGIGRNGESLRAMLDESEALFAETGRYYGLERLTLFEEEPIRYEKLFSRIRGGMVQARETALNISASPIVKELGELCFALYTPEGDSIALSTGIIVHVHTMGMAIKFMIRNDYETNPGIADGDIFTNNDCMIGNVHTADVATLVPIFWESELIGWAGGITHEVDIGAISPGSNPTAPTSRYHDGLDLPCQKIGEHDTVYRSHQIRCQWATRTPMYWLLDERTRIAGCHMVRDAVHKVVREEGIEIYKQFIREVIEEGRRSFRARIRELLMPGKYYAPSFIDVPFASERALLPRKAARDSIMHAPLALTIGSDGEFELSMEGANAWGWHAFNCPIAAMQGALWVLLAQTVIPNDKVNDGAYLGTIQHYPQGSWCNPGTPLASAATSWYFLQPAFTGLFRSLSRAFYARGFLEEINAGFASSQNVCQGGGRDHYGKESAFSNFEMSSVGGGAGTNKDGLDHAAAMWNPEGEMGDVEVWEMNEPLLYLGRRVKPSSAGMGKHRGGSGFESLRMVFKTDDLEMDNMGPGSMFTCAGIFGGYPGAAGYRHNVHHTNMKELIAAKRPYPTREGDPEDSEVSKLVTGEVVRDRRALTLPESFSEYDLYLSYLRGGPGAGDPIERDPVAVEQDLNGGYLLLRLAYSVYGAVAEQDSEGCWHVNVDETWARRAEIRKERARRARPVREWLQAERERVVSHQFASPVIDMYRSSMSLSPEWAARYRSFWQLPNDFTF